MMLLTAGCSAEKSVQENRTPMEYTVVPGKDIPENFRNTLEEKKYESFTMTYAEGEYLYIAEGYGRMPTGGYSIRLDEVSSSGSEIYIHTTLKGPGAGEAVNKMESYPYIVLKTEYTDKKVVFE